MARIRLPVASGISRRVYRRISQDVCPWNVKFSRDLSEESFRPREILEGDARAVAKRILNIGSVDDVATLVTALHNPEPLVAEHAAWALERIRGNTTAS